MFTITGEDIRNRKMVNNFNVKVIDENDPPVAIQRIDVQNVMLGEAFTIHLRDPLFSDEDAGDSISIALTQQNATSLPSWINFDSKTFQITGIPTGSKPSDLNLFIKATDRAGGKAYLPFHLLIEKPIGYIDSMTSNIMVYPNPTSGIIDLLVSSKFPVSPYVDVYDFKGSKIGQVRLTLDDLMRQRATIELSVFPKGLYFLKFRSGNEVFVEKVIVLSL